MKQKILCGALVLFGMTLAGCAGGGAYYVRSGPPAPRYEAVGAGRPGFVWTNGYWDWRCVRRTGVRFGWRRSGVTRGATGGCIVVTGDDLTSMTHSGCELRVLK
jgi:WXXGXW repeat (2 copies)